MTVQTKNKIISAIATALIMVVVVLICWGLGLYKPNPPIPEAGVEVNLGNSDMGLGDALEPSSEDAQQTPSQPTAAEENVISQTHEQTTSVPNTEKPAKVDTQKPTKTETPNNVKEEPKLYDKATFAKRNNSGGSQGTTQGGGNQGKEGGDPNSSRYDGNPGNGGSGWSLSGRSKRSIPQPKSDENEPGFIVVKITVNPNGDVINAEVVKKDDKGNHTTITNSNMRTSTINAAKQAKFSASKTAPERQYGYIVYQFIYN